MQFEEPDDARRRLAKRSESSNASRTPTADSSPPVAETVGIPIGDVEVIGHLTVPRQPLGMVVFAHGSGSSRHSPRNRYVAEVLNKAGLATLLIDLLTPDEAADRGPVFDIALLSQRLVAVTTWLVGHDEFADLRIGYFGASTGAAAALKAAADPATQIDAVVSRGGRPDLAGPSIADVTAPTLLIVGGNDHAVLSLNQQAAQAMSTEAVLTVVPGATHLFAEPGALEQVAELARDWFVNQLSSPAVARQPGTRAENET